MREIGVEELLATTEDPFVRHQVDPATTSRAWVSGRATVVEATRGRRPDDVPGRHLTCLGPEHDLEPLMASVAAATEPPLRISVEDGAYAAVPAPWRFPRQGHWHWMLTRTPCPAPAVPVVEIEDRGEVEAVLDEANPESFARPGSPAIECWLGVRREGDAVAVGALRREPDGTGHLRAVTVLPAHGGQGLGRAVSAALTLRALDDGPGVATLGVYVSNAPALAVYRRLGYRTVHTFASGPVIR